MSFSRDNCRRHVLIKTLVRWRNGCLWTFPSVCQPERTICSATHQTWHALRTAVNFQIKKQCTFYTQTGVWSLVIQSQLFALIAELHKEFSWWVQAYHRSTGWDPRNEGQWWVGSTRRFGGAGEDAAGRCWKWQNWARACLRLLQAKNIPPEALGSAFLCLLDGPAKMALEGLALDELSAPDGAERVFQCLDARFPDLEAHERTAAYTSRSCEVFWESS